MPVLPAETAGGSEGERHASLYNAILQGAFAGILVAELESKAFVYANDTICNMYGYERDELLRLAVSDIHPPEHLAAVVAVFDAQARGELDTERDLPCLHADGTVFYCDISSRMISFLASRTTSAGSSILW